MVWIELLSLFIFAGMGYILEVKFMILRKIMRRLRMKGDFGAIFFGVVMLITILFNRIVVGNFLQILENEIVVAMIMAIIMGILFGSGLANMNYTPSKLKKRYRLRRKTAFLTIRKQQREYDFFDLIEKRGG